MGSEWSRVQISDVCELIIDCVNKTAPQVNYATPYKMIRTPNIRNGRIDLTNCRYVEKDTYQKWTRRASVEPGDILLTREAPMGEVGLVDFNDTVFLGQRIMQYRVDKEALHPRFLLYSFLSADLQNQFRMHDGTGSVVSHIRVPDCSKFELNLPPLSEQNHVVEILGNLDDKIQLNHQISQTFEQMAQILFKSWFVDFEPVKAKIAARERWQAFQPENELASPVCYAAELDEPPAVGDLESYMNRAAMQAISGKTADQLDALCAEDPERYNELYETAALFPSAMQPSELGEIPEGWEASAFQSCLSKTIGGDWGKDKPDEKHTEKVRIIRGTDLPKIYSGNENNAPERYVESKKLKSRRLIDGDIVIEISGGSKGQPTGRSLFMAKAIMDRLGICEPASFCRLFRPLTESIGLLLSLHLQKIYAEGKTWFYQNQSTGISNFQTKVFLEKELVIVPPASVQDSFYKRVMPLLNRLHSNENVALSMLRDTLLPKLLSGELTLSEEEEAQAEATA